MAQPNIINHYILARSKEVTDVATPIAMNCLYPSVWSSAWFPWRDLPPLWRLLSSRHRLYRLKINTCFEEGHHKTRSRRLHLDVSCDCKWWNLLCIPRMLSGWHNQRGTWSKDNMPHFELTIGSTWERIEYLEGISPWVWRAALRRGGWTCCCRGVSLVSGADPNLIDLHQVGCALSDARTPKLNQKKISPLNWYKNLNLTMLYVLK